jgi:hypothetical protein
MGGPDECAQTAAASDGDLAGSGALHGRLQASIAVFVARDGPLVAAATLTAPFHG